MGMPVDFELGYNARFSTRSDCRGDGLYPRLNSNSLLCVGILWGLAAMPIYEYECKECGHRLEALQKIADAPLKECPQCQHEALAKLVSASSFRLKGGGWYETDFKTGAKRHGTQDTSAPSSSTKDAKASAPAPATGGTSA